MYIDIQKIYVYIISSEKITSFGGLDQQVPATCLSLQLIARCLSASELSWVGVKSEVHHKVM